MWALMCIAPLSGAEVVTAVGFLETGWRWGFGCWKDDEGEEEGDGEMEVVEDGDGCEDFEVCDDDEGDVYRRFSGLRTIEELRVTNSPFLSAVGRRR